MGYSTDFEGELKFHRELTVTETALLLSAIQNNDDHPYEIDLELTDNRDGLKWNGCEKTYGMVEAVRHVIAAVKPHFELFLHGTLIAQGEDVKDRWLLIADGNNVYQQGVKVESVGGFNIFLDTETTGFNKGNNEVLEISIVNDSGKALLDTLVQPVKNKHWDSAQDIHGIKPEDVFKSYIPTLEEITPIIQGIIKDNTMIAYNVDFDAWFLRDVLRDIAHKQKCCMMAYADFRGVPGRHAGGSKYHKLIDAAEHTDHKWQGKAHRSLSDTLACRHVWKFLKGQA